MSASTKFLQILPNVKPSNLNFVKPQDAFRKYEIFISSPGFAAIFLKLLTMHATEVTNLLVC